MTARGEASAETAHHADGRCCTHGAASELRLAIAGTICSELPSACDGSFTGPKLGRAQLPNGGSIELSGTLPMELAGLTDLEEIALAAYDISGTFPPEFANFDRLKCPTQ